MSRLGRIFGVVILIGSAAALQPGSAFASGWTTGTAGAPAAADQTSGFPSLAKVSCTAGGNCLAAGYFFDSSGNQLGWLVEESSGSWGAGSEAPLPAGAATSGQTVYLNSVSCVSAGNCSAAGSYVDSSGNQQGLLLDETSGVWAASKVALPLNAEVSGQQASLASISCPSAGSCSAVGTYLDSRGRQRGLLATRSAGAWASGVQAVLPSGGLPTLTSVSCASAGNCTAVGAYMDSSGNFQGLLLSESSGAWAAGTEAVLPADAATNALPDLTQVSCAAAGSCGAAGTYLDYSGNSQGVLLDESGGSWAAGHEAVLPAGGISETWGFSLNSISCPSAGNCAAAGSYLDSSFGQQGLLLSESSGSWGAGVEVSPPAPLAGNPMAVLSSVACTAPGACSAVGSYVDSSFNQWGLLVDEGSSAVQAALPVGAAGTNQDALLTSVSCASLGSCGAVGTYLDSAGAVHGWRLDKAASAVDSDLAIGSAPNVVTDATSPAGASVTYASPSSSDEGGESPAVSCSPASGSTFAVGSTTVTCTATDADDSNGPVKSTFTVAVKGALDQLQELSSYVSGLGPGTSLKDKVQAAIGYDQSGDVADTCSELAAIVHEAKAQSGRKLTSTQAAHVIGSANEIAAVLGC